MGNLYLYDSKGLSLDEKISMYKDCKNICYGWRADTLDCSVSYSRQFSDCPFEEIMSYLNEDTYVTVINRGVWGCLAGHGREHFEVAFRTIDRPIDYFLFI